MTKTQMIKQLTLLQKDVQKAYTRSKKISKALNIPENSLLEEVLQEINVLLDCANDVKGEK
ncbi:hypothetical protein [Pseudomonas sp.]|uniref:hypothetical protein n=1 Tax=Pseudomonas sp. TaxID=306 RepID=UPI003FD774AD